MGSSGAGPLQEKAEPRRRETQEKGFRPEGLSYKGKPKSGPALSCGEQAEGGLYKGKRSPGERPQA